MANFTLTQSFTTQGLCQTLVATDTSDYSGNTNEGVLPKDVVSKVWTFRDSSGTIIKTEYGDGDKYSASCSISLLTLNITVTLGVSIQAPSFSNTYQVQNSLLIPCLGV